MKQSINTHPDKPRLDRPAGKDQMDIYQRMKTAWPHLSTLAKRARAGNTSARNALATNVLSGSIKPPLTTQDTWTISDWHPQANR